MEIQYPNLEEFSPTEMLDLINDYQHFQTSNNYFFKVNDLQIMFDEIMDMIEKKQFTSSIWIFLLTFLCDYSLQAKKKEVPYFQLFDIQQLDISKQYIKLNDLTDQIQQSSNNQNSKKRITIVKLQQKYFLTIIHYDVLYVVNYGSCKLEQIQLFLSKVMEQEYEVRLIQVFLHKDASHFYFFFIYQFLSGEKMDKITFTAFDDKLTHDKLVWLVLSYGFAYANNILKDDMGLEEYNGVNKQKELVISELQKRRQGKGENKRKNNMRISTPKTIQEREEQMKQLNERISYLKVLNGEGDDNDILSSEIFQIRMKKLNKDIEEEFQNMDLMKQNQLLFQSSQNQLLKNASEILKGRFNSQLFTGLGLSVSDNKVEALKQIQQHNYSTILDPITKGDKLPPGEFAKTQKDNLVAMKYGIKVSRDALHDLRYGKVRREVANLYCKFLEEFSISQNQRQGFMYLEDFEDIICEQRTGKECIRQNENYLSNFDIIYFPIKQDEEYSFGVIDVQHFTIKHYFLNQRITQPVSSLQQIFKAWNIRDNEILNEIQLRQDLQHRYLQYLIYWVRRQAYIHKLSKISNMRLWKIRIEDINTVPTVQETGMYLLSILTNMCIKSEKIDKPGNSVIIREILENIICTVGIQDKTSNKYAIEYFSKKIVNLIK